MTTPTHNAEPSPQASDPDRKLLILTAIGSIFMALALAGAVVVIRNYRERELNALRAQKETAKALAATQTQLARAGDAQLFRPNLAWPQGNDVEAEQIKYLWSLGVGLGLYSALPPEHRAPVVEALRSEHTNVRVVAVTLLMELGAASEDPEMLVEVMPLIDDEATRALVREILTAYTPQCFDAMLQRIEHYLDTPMTPEHKTSAETLVDTLSWGNEGWSAEQKGRMRTLAEKIPESLQGTAWARVLKTLGS